jgi:LPS sulfotransferase NodH
MTEANSDSTYWAFNRDFDFPPTLPVMKYLVLSAPRTGSTMLCSALTETQNAGRPLEYFNGKALDAFRAMTGSKSLNAYIDYLLYRRTSPNGVFGMKLHFGQFRDLFGPKSRTTGVEFLKLFDKFILIHRRDKISQAISMFVAQSAGVWNRRTAAQATDLPELQQRDYEQIAANLVLCLKEESGWRELIATRRLEAIELAYEDMIASPSERFGEVLSFLGIRVDNPQSIRPTTVRLSNDGHQAVRESFLKVIGGQSRPNDGVS